MTTLYLLFDLPASPQVKIIATYRVRPKEIQVGHEKRVRLVVQRPEEVYLVGDLSGAAAGERRNEVVIVLEKVII